MVKYLILGKKHSKVPDCLELRGKPYTRFSLGHMRKSEEEIHARLFRKQGNRAIIVTVIKLDKFGTKVATLYYTYWRKYRYD